MKLIPIKVVTGLNPRVSYWDEGDISTSDDLRVIHKDTVLFLIKFYVDLGAGEVLRDMSGVSAMRLTVRSGPDKTDTLYVFHSTYASAAGGYSPDLANGYAVMAVPITDAVGTPLATALAAATTTPDTYVEPWLELTSIEGGIPETLGRFQLKILEEIDDGAAGTPSPTSPTYYTAAEIDAMFISELAPYLSSVAATELTIATGAVTAATQHHTIDTEGDAASDDLTTIASWTGFLYLRLENAARVVTLKHGTSANQIACPAATDVVMQANVEYLLHRATASDPWRIVGPVFDPTKQPLDADLTALAALASTGMIARTAANTYALRTITAPAAGITVTNGDGVSGNPTMALADDLAALEALAANGLIARIAANSYALRALASANTSITITNGDGVAAAPDLVLNLANANSWTAAQTFALIAMATATEKTVASGVLTVDKSSHTVQPESSTADDIDTISGLADGAWCLLVPADAGTDTLTFKHGTGNLSIVGAADLDIAQGGVLAHRIGSTVYLIGGGGGGASTAAGISVAATPTNYSAAAANVEAHLAGIDSQLGTIAAGGYSGTSTTSLLIEIASKVFTTQAGLAFAVGTRIRAASDADPTNYMEGVCTDYTGTSLTIDVDNTGGSGTLADWNLTAAGDKGDTGAAGAAAPGSLEITWPAGSFGYPTDYPAPLDQDTGTNGTILRQLFDDTQQEYILLPFIVPQNLDTAGTVTFSATGYAVTAAASKYIQLSFEHCAKADTESWDAAYTAEDSGDLATDASQDQLDQFTWTETVSNLGWAAGDHVRAKLSRKAPSGTNLSGDWGLCAFTIRIPRAS